MRLYGPNGALVEETALLVGDSGFGNSAGTGDYGLYFFKAPAALVVSDDGGPMTSAAHDGTILVGDLDAWSFTACRGDRLVLQVDKLSDTNSFGPLLRLYGRDGALLASQSGVSPQISLVATNSGQFTVLVSDGPSSSRFDGTGMYRLAGNGLSAGGDFRRQPYAWGRWWQRQRRFCSAYDDEYRYTCAALAAIVDQPA